MPLPEDLHAELDRRLAPVDAARAAFPGDRTTRQPVHTCYGLDCGALDDAGVRTVTGVEHTVLARLAGRAARMDPPATGSGGRRPTIPW